MKGGITLDRELIEEINDYLVMIFNEVLEIEENALKESDFSGLSVKEIHTIEAIGLSGERRMSDLAKEMRLTPGTISVSVQNLVEKAYVNRMRRPDDRRSVYLELTAKGKLVYRLHRKFHIKMVEETIEGLDKDETDVLLKGLRNLHAFLIRTKVE